jgi:hypothetical protein
MSAARPAEAHASAADLELYVIDALAPATRRQVEQHVATCDRCALGLQAEAVLEVTLGQLWSEVQRARRPVAAVVPLRPRRSGGAPCPPMRRSGPLGGLAAAAIAVLFIGWWTDGGRIDSLRSPSALAPPPSCAITALFHEGASDDRLVCISEALPSPTALASWATCAAPAPAFASALCTDRSPPSAVQQ